MVHMCCMVCCIHMLHSMVHSMVHDMLHGMMHGMVHGCCMVCYMVWCTDAAWYAAVSSFSNTTYVPCIMYYVFTMYSLMYLYRCAAQEPRSAKGSTVVLREVHCRRAYAHVYACPNACSCMCALLVYIHIVCLCIVGAHIRIDARAHVHTHVHTRVLTDYARGECRCQPLKECCLLEQCAPSKEVLARRARATHRVDDWPPRRYGGRCPEGSSSTPAIEQQRG